MNAANNVTGDDWQRIAAEPGTVTLEGFHALKHALRFGADIRLATVTDKEATLRFAATHAPDLTRRLAALLVEAPTGSRHPTGVMALAVRPEWRIENRSAPLVLLDNPRNLGNVGAVIRLCAGIGAAGVMTTGDLDPWHPQVLRGSAGLHFACPVGRTTVDELPEGPLYGLDPAGQELRHATIPDNAVLAFGSERHGLTPAVRERVDGLLAIPMRTGVSSYNLATSVAMTLFHWRSHQPI